MKNGLNVDSCGNNCYYFNGFLHREDGPAIERLNGTKEWFVHGRRHREGNLPAIEYHNGDESYFVNGKYHREDGPAYKWEKNDENKNNYFYLNGKKYSEQDYWEEIKKRKSLNCILSNIKCYIKCPTLK